MNFPMVKFREREISGTLCFKKVAYSNWHLF